MLLAHQHPEGSRYTAAVEEADTDSADYYGVPAQAKQLQAAVVARVRWAASTVLGSQSGALTTGVRKQLLRTDQHSHCVCVLGETS